MPQFVTWIAEMLLIAAALFISGHALYGYILEKRAESQNDPDKKQMYINDAKTHYATASLTRPWVLIAIFSGTLAKAVVAIVELI